MLFSTAPLSIIDHPADRLHCCGEPRLGYRWIFLHATGGTNSLNWLSTTSPASKPVSCHRLIAKNGTIYKIVPDHLIAYTQGPSVAGPVPANGENMNQWALSIELENLDNGRDPYPATQVRSCALQIVEWWGAHSFPAVVAHAWMQADKHDPLGFPWADFYALCWKYLQEIARR